MQTEYPITNTEVYPLALQLTLHSLDTPGVKALRCVACASAGPDKLARNDSHQRLRKEKSMKRGNVRHETKTKPEALIIHARINGGKPEPIRMLRSSKEPELGEIFRGVPIRFKTNLFQKALRVESISVEKGISVFHCTTDVTRH